jgi:hypothetical protein
MACLVKFNVYNTGYLLAENVAEMGKIIIVFYVKTVLSQRINKKRRASNERGAL